MRHLRERITEMHAVQTLHREVNPHGLQQRRTSPVAHVTSHTRFVPAHVQTKTCILSNENVNHHLSCRSLAHDNLPSPPHLPLLHGTAAHPAAHVIHSSVKAGVAALISRCCC